MNISNPNTFSHFVHVSELFSLELENNSVQQLNITRDKPEEEMNLKEHLKTLRNSIYGSPNKHKLKDYTFTDVIQYFPGVQLKKKIYVKSPSGEYIVKKFFTEGIQHVPKGMIHTYYTDSKPLDIYISNGQEFTPYTFNSIYNSLFSRHRIEHRESKSIQPNTFYLVIAPCHTHFIKSSHQIQQTNVEGDRNVYLPSNSFAANFHVKNISQELSNSMEHRLSPSFEQNRCETPSTVMNDLFEGLKRYPDSSTPQPSTSREIVGRRPASPSQLSARSFDFSERRQEVGETSTAQIREGPNKRIKTEYPVSPHNVVEISVSERSADELTNTEDKLKRSIFAVRKEEGIESYCLRPDSTFRLKSNGSLTGSFKIYNEDMDPECFQYHGKRNIIVEIARFKNGSTFETPIIVDSDFIEQLREAGNKKEKMVVKYFYGSVFKKIEATYKKFLEMRNVRMIGSCVPAIVQLDNTRFSGSISDVYETNL